MLAKIIAPALLLGIGLAFSESTSAHEKDLGKFDLEDGKTIFGMYCATCHGATGAGDGAAAAALNPKPRDLTNAEYISTRSWEELREVIAMGGANAGMSAVMPAWSGALKKDQIDNVLAYVLSLSRPGDSAEAEE